MKKILCLIAVILLLGGALISCGSSRQNKSKGATLGDITNPIDFTITRENRSVVGYTGEIGENLVIPEVFNNKGKWYQATAIDSSAFSYCSELVSVTLSDSITSIGEYAFSGCSKLSGIALSKGVSKIGFSAFSGCTALKSITVDEGNTVYEAKGNCLIKKASKTLIEGCQTSVIPTDGSVTAIGDNAFFGCKKLTSIVIPESVTSIGLSAFDSCTGLTSIHLPKSVTKINHSAFSGCKGITSMTVSEDNPVYEVKGNCLIEKASKTMVVGFSNSIIPTDGSVTAIGDFAFDYCQGVTSIAIPDCITRIGKFAFVHCHDLTSITIPDSVTAIDGSAFSYCKKLTSVTIPNSVITIGDSAFTGCQSLTSITIPDSVITIGETAFQDCTNLIDIIVDENNAIYKSINTNLYSKDGTVLIAYAIGKSDTTFTISDSVTTIGVWAFGYSNNLESVTIPDSVTTIESWAFARCNNLTSITFEGTVEQWNSIERAVDWSLDSPVTEVVCSDGLVELK